MNFRGVFDGDIEGIEDGVGDFDFVEDEVEGVETRVVVAGTVDETCNAPISKPLALTPEPHFTASFSTTLAFPPATLNFPISSSAQTPGVHTKNDEMEGSQVKTDESL